jgi:hypothetical protein
VDQRDVGRKEFHGVAQVADLGVLESPAMQVLDFGEQFRPVAPVHPGDVDKVGVFGPEVRVSAGVVTVPTFEERGDDCFDLALCS